jgi:hypothetical protein
MIARTPFQEPFFGSWMEGADGPNGRPAGALRLRLRLPACRAHGPARGGCPAPHMVAVDSAAGLALVLPACGDGEGEPTSIQRDDASEREHGDHDHPGPPTGVPRPRDLAHARDGLGAAKGRRIGLYCCLGRRK